MAETYQSRGYSWNKERMRKPKRVRTMTRIVDEVVAHGIIPQLLAWQRRGEPVGGENRRWGIGRKERRSSLGSSKPSKVEVTLKLLHGYRPLFPYCSQPQRKLPALFLPVFFCLFE